MPNQASACETGMKSAQTELEGDLGSFQIQSEKGRNRNSPHRRAALTLATVWGIFRADAAPRLYIFLISCFISQVGRLECGCGTDSSGEASQTWRESNPSLEVKVATLHTRKTFSIFRLYYRKTQ